MLVCFKSGPLGIGKDAALPSRLVVMPWGRNEINGGEHLIVNETTLAELPGNQARLNFDKVALDFEHNSVKGTEHYAGEPLKVAAYATPRVIAGEGIVYENIEYTQDGIDAIRGGHYMDLSPTVKVNAANEVTFIHSAACCRVGQIRGLELVAATADPFETEIKKNNDMDYKAILLALLSLNTDASEEEIQTASTAAAETLQGMKTMTGDLSSLKGQLNRLAEDVKTLTTAEGLSPLSSEAAEKLQTLTGEVATLKASLVKNERQRIKDEALREGKLIPASAEELELDQYRTLVAELPAGQVPVEQRTPEHLKVLSSGAPTTEESRSAEVVRRSLGISKEDWEKHS